MSRLQRLFVSLLPKGWAESMEADSRAWWIRCPSCGHEVSVWDAGGVRWKAKGRPWMRMRCSQCGKASWTQLLRRDASGGQNTE